MPVISDVTGLAPSTASIPPRHSDNSRVCRYDVAGGRAPTSQPVGQTGRAKSRPTHGRAGLVVGLDMAGFRRWGRR